MYLAEDQRQTYIERARMLINNVRLMNNSADIHTVANIRATAQIFIQMLETRSNTMTAADCDKIIDGITAQCCRLFKQRFILS